MHQNARKIESFYQSLQKRDAEAIASVYHPDATFTDPVFDLNGEDVGDMWRMFCVPGGDLDIEYSHIAADDSGASAHWEASYVFRPTGRPVHNIIEAQFELNNGLITAHRDDFDLARWSRQAFGLRGRLLGWSPLFQNRIRSEAIGQLRKYQKRYKGRT